MDRLVGNKNPKNKPGFEELGSVTPYGLARLADIEKGTFDTSRLIEKKLEQEKTNGVGSCEYICPPTLIQRNAGASNNCYEPGLLLGKCYPIPKLW